MVNPVVVNQRNYEFEEIKKWLIEHDGKCYKGEVLTPWFDYRDDSKYTKSDKRIQKLCKQAQKAE